MCALRRQRSSEAAALLRRASGRRLTRTYSHPTQSRLVSNGSLTNSVANSDASTVSVRSETNGNDKKSTGTSKREIDFNRKSSQNQRITLSPLSDEVFLGEEVTESKNEEEDANVTPSRRIRNLKEFMELGRGNKLSCQSDPASPSVSPNKKSTAATKQHSSSTSSPVNGSPTTIRSRNMLIISKFEGKTTIPTDTLIPVHESFRKSQSKSKFYTCLSGEAKEFPPSGLTPTEPPSESCFTLTSSKSTTCNGIIPNNCVNNSSSSTKCTKFTNRETADMQQCDNNNSDSVVDFLNVRGSRYSGNVGCSDMLSTSSSTNGSTCSSNLCPAETAARRCFSESDASLGLLLDDHTQHEEEDEALCVEVWENPVASSPLGVESTTFTNRPIGLVETTTEGNISKILSSEGTTKTAQLNHRAILLTNPLNCSSIKTDLETHVVSLEQSAKAVSAHNTTLANTAGTGWTVSLGGSTTINQVTKLPPPDKFGGGNPFLMTVCVTVLLQHRNFIMSQRLDHNDLAMHFDKMVRKHNVHHVLKQARHRYQHYCSLHANVRSNSHQAC